MFWHCCCNAPQIINCSGGLLSYFYGWYFPQDGSATVEYPQALNSESFLLKYTTQNPPTEMDTNALLLVTVPFPQASVFDFVILQGTIGNTFFDSPDTLCFDITAYDVDGAPTSDPGWDTNDVVALARTTATVEYCASLSGIAHNFTINITSIFNEILQRPGWSSGNRVLLLLEVNDNTIIGGSVAGGAVNGVTISYQINCPQAAAWLGAYDPDYGSFIDYPSIVSDQWKAEFIATLPSNANSNLLVLCEGVTIPQGTVVPSATLHLVGTQVGAADSTICGGISAWDIDNANDSSSPPTWDLNDVLTLPRTSASGEICIDFNVGFSTPIDLQVDVTNVVNEVVARPGWSNGNNILFLIETNDNTVFGVPISGQDIIVTPVTDTSPATRLTWER